MVLTSFKPHINPMRPSIKVGNWAWGEAVGKHSCLKIIPGDPGEKKRKAWMMPFRKLGKRRGRSFIFKEMCMCACMHSFTSRRFAEGQWSLAEKGGGLPGVPDSKRNKTQPDCGEITVLWEVTEKVSVDTQKIYVARQFTL